MTGFVLYVDHMTDTATHTPTETIDPASHQTSNSTTNPTTDPSPDPSPTAGFPDVRPALNSAIALGAQVLKGVQPDQLELPTPCVDFDVRQLAAHLLMVLNRIAKLGAGQEFSATHESFDHILAQDWGATYDALAGDVKTSWTDESLSRMIEVPWATLPGAVMAMTYINEVSVHTWDLATATGQHPAWDDAVLQIAFDTMQRALPATGRAAPIGDLVVVPFDDVVPTEDGAPLIDRLVAWNGRRP